jgi:hypothetical protein
MGFLMTKTQPPVSPFNSQPADFARVCLLTRRIGAKAALRAVAITKNPSAAISTLTHKPFYR